MDVQQRIEFLRATLTDCYIQLHNDGIQIFKNSVSSNPLMPKLSDIDIELELAFRQVFTSITFEIPVDEVLIINIIM